MSMFKKKETSSLPEAPGQALSMEPHASSPAPDASAVIGGLGWYRTQFHRAMKLALGLSLALMVSLAVIALLLLNQPKPRYFAATPDLRLAPLVPLDQPLLTQSGLLTWVSDTITGAMSLNFLEWREKLEAVRPNFDDDTFKSFESSQGVESTQRLIATVLVCRASTATTPRGVVIQQVVLKRES